MEKIDVIINVYGKPWQTLCTLKSLMHHSGRHIDRIYLIEERQQPEDVRWIYSYFDNLITYVPFRYEFAKNTVNFRNDVDRFSIRYQYGFEKSDKRHVFITHNDVLYVEDVVGGMLSKIGEAIGIGEIGQCWNCPANHVGLCSGEKFYEWNPTYEQVLELPLPHVRTYAEAISREYPKPMPECRLNECACLIDRTASNRETPPNGNTNFFGIYGIDLGIFWFRSLHIKGYKFVDYRRGWVHSYWSDLETGYQTQLNAEIYVKSEERAKRYFFDYLAI
jgi:hypothetical protein